MSLARSSHHLHPDRPRRLATAAVGYQLGTGDSLVVPSSSGAPHRDEHRVERGRRRPPGLHFLGNTAAGWVLLGCAGDGGDRHLQVQRSHAATHRSRLAAAVAQRRRTASIAAARAAAFPPPNRTLKRYEPLSLLPSAAHVFRGRSRPLLRRTSHRGEVVRFPSSPEPRTKPVKITTVEAINASLYVV